MDRIVAFYSLSGTDHRGRALEQMLSWDDETLERVHDYIQWLFPTEQASAFNPWAPLVTGETKAAFARDAVLRDRLARSLDRMLTFYGFEWDAARTAIVPSSGFDARGRVWLTRGNHNHLRITRILDSLVQLSRPDLAIAFFAALDQLYARRPSAITRDSYEYWAAAAERARPSSA